MDHQMKYSLLRIACVAALVSYSAAGIEDCSVLQELRKCGTNAYTAVEECFTKRELSNKTVETKLQQSGINFTLYNLTMCTSGWITHKFKQRPCTIQGQDQDGKVFGVILMKYDLECSKTSRYTPKSSGPEHFYQYEDHEILYSYNGSSEEREVSDDNSDTSFNATADANLGYASSEPPDQGNVTIYALLATLIVILSLTNILTICYYRRDKRHRNRPDNRTVDDAETEDL